MKRLTLSPTQTATLTALAGVTLADHSPLPGADAPQALTADDPDFVALRDQHALEPDGGTWRLNTVAGAIAVTCAQPQEVLAFRPLDPASPGLFACRRASMWVLCSVDHSGQVEVTVPFSRDLMIATVMSGLASERPEPTPVGFRFQGPPSHALAFSVLAGQMAGGRELTEDDALDALAAAGDDFVRTAVLSAMGNTADGLDTDSARHHVLGQLVRAGHLEPGDGGLRLTAAAAAVFTEPAAAGVSLERWDAAGAGLTVSGFQAFRCGDRLVAFRLAPGDGPPAFEWAEVTRAELRDLAAATFIPPDRLARQAG